MPGIGAQMPIHKPSDNDSSMINCNDAIEFEECFCTSPPFELTSLICSHHGKRRMRLAGRNPSDWIFCEPAIKEVRVSIPKHLHLELYHLTYYSRGWILVRYVFIAVICLTLKSLRQS